MLFASARVRGVGLLPRRPACCAGLTLLGWISLHCFTISAASAARSLLSLSALMLILKDAHGAEERHLVMARHRNAAAGSGALSKQHARRAQHPLLFCL